MTPFVLPLVHVVTLYTVASIGRKIARKADSIMAYHIGLWFSLIYFALFICICQVSA